MIAVETVWIFLSASVLVTLAPGPDNVFILTQGLARGRRSALVTAWGMCSGISFHTAAAALGVSAVVYASTWAFAALKWAGALYLFYIAFQTIRKRRDPLATPGSVPMETQFQTFRRGFLMNVLNPKVGIFFLAFLPQFVDASSADRVAQMLQLGALFMLQATLLFSLLAYFAGSFGAYLMKSETIRLGLSWAAASVFFALGVRLALARE